MNSKTPYNLILSAVFISLMNLNFHAQVSLRGNAYYKIDKKQSFSVDTMQVYLFHPNSDTLSLTTYDSKFQFNYLSPGTYNLICQSERNGTYAREIIVSGDFMTFVEVDFAPSRKKRRKGLR